MKIIYVNCEWTWVKLWSLQCVLHYEVEKATWKKLRLERDSNPRPSDTGAMLYLLSYQATWIDGHLWVRHIPDDSEYTWIWIYENHICELRINMSEIVILAVCFQLKQLKKQPEKNSGLD